MRLTEAIKHARKVARDNKTCMGCRKDHEQLANWLEELRVSRKIIKELHKVIKQNGILVKPIWDTLAEMGVIA